MPAPPTLAGTAERSPAVLASGDASPGSRRTPETDRVSVDPIDAVCDPGSRSSATIISEVRSLWRLAWDRFRRNRLAVLGLAFLVLMMSAAILAPWIAPYTPNAVSLAPDDLLHAPSAAHLFGTDFFGVDQAPTGFKGTQDLPAVTEELVECGPRDGTILRVLGGNYPQVFESVWGK